MAVATRHGPGRGSEIKSHVELVADTLAEAAGVVSRNEGLAGVAAQAPTEIATKAATLAPTTTDEYRIERLLGMCCHGERPKFAGKGSICARSRRASLTSAVTGQPPRA